MTYKNRKALISIAGVLPLVYGCGGASAPLCDDADVLGIVDQIVQENFLNYYAGFYNPYGPGGMNYQLLKEASESSSEFGEYLSRVEKDASESVFSVSSIRTQSKDDGIRFVECAAELEIEQQSATLGERVSYSLPITYTAQYTDDGSEIYVEIFGLE